MIEAKSKLSFIEGMRGLAAIIVVLHHFSLAFYPALNFGEINQTHYKDGSLELFIANSPLNLIYNGGFAVCIFFILSGYVLSNSYHKSKKVSILFEYAIKRYFRLLIPVSVTILIAYLCINTQLFFNQSLGEVTKTNDWLSSAFDHNGSLIDVARNMFIDVFFFKDNSYNPVLWTMTYELLGSFLIFGFLLSIYKINQNYWLYILLILVLFATQNNFYAAFILGAFLNKLDVNQNAFYLKLFSHKSVLIGFALVGVFFASYPLVNNVNGTMYEYMTFTFLFNYEFYHVVGSFFIMCVVLNSSGIKNILSKNCFGFIGKISFSFYLLHFIILCSLTCFLFKQWHPLLGYNMAVLAASALSLPVIIMAAMFYQRWIDQFGINLSNKILRIVMPKTEPKI